MHLLFSLVLAYSLLFTHCDMLHPDSVWSDHASQYWEDNIEYHRRLQQEYDPRECQELQVYTADGDLIEYCQHIGLTIKPDERRLDSKIEPWTSLLSLINNYVSNSDLQVAVLNSLKPEYSHFADVMPDSDIHALLQTIERKVEEYALAENDNAKTYNITCEWKPVTKGNIPSGAVVVGYDIWGNENYIRRLRHEGRLLPGTVERHYQGTPTFDEPNWLDYDGHEVLVAGDGCDLTWEMGSGLNIPSGAIQGGKMANGDPLYITRHSMSGVYLMGRVQKSEPGCVFNFWDNKLHYDQCEMLCLKSVNFS